MHLETRGADDIYKLDCAVLTQCRQVSQADTHDDASDLKARPAVYSSPHMLAIALLLPENTDVGWTVPVIYLRNEPRGAVADTPAGRTYNPMLFLPPGLFCMFIGARGILAWRRSVKKESKVLSEE